MNRAQFTNQITVHVTTVKLNYANKRHLADAHPYPKVFALLPEMSGE